MTKIITLISLLLCTLAFSQNKFQKGYFIDNAGNSIECLIRNIGWKNNPTSFDYKLSEDGTTQKGVIANVKEFSVDNAYKFIRFDVQIDKSLSLTNRLGTVREPEWEKETLFLKVLVDGKAALYQYEDVNLIKYFVSTENHAGAVQLLYKEYKVNTRIHENNMYRQQLYNIMKDVMPQQRFEKVNYNKHDLVRIFVDYNEATGEKTENLAEKQNKGALRLKITPGIAMASLNTENLVDSRSDYDFDKQVSFRIGMELEYILPFNNKKWSLFIDPHFQTYKNDGVNGTHTWEADYKSINIPIGARHYMYLNQESKLFINGAVVFAFDLSSSSIKLNDYSYDISRTTSTFAGAGYSWKSYSAEARYTFNHGLLTGSNWTANYSSIGLVLAYSLF